MLAILSVMTTEGIGNINLILVVCSETMNKTLMEYALGCGMVMMSLIQKVMGNSFAFHPITEEE